MPELLQVRNANHHIISTRFQPRQAVQRLLWAWLPYCFSIAASHPFKEILLKSTSSTMVLKRIALDKRSMRIFGLQCEGRRSVSTSRI